MFSMVPGDVLCDRDEVFKDFVDVDSNFSMSKDAYLAPGHLIMINMFISCYIVL